MEGDAQRFHVHLYISQAHMLRGGTAYSGFVDLALEHQSAIKKNAPTITCIGYYRGESSETEILFFQMYQGDD